MLITWNLQEPAIELEDGCMEHSNCAVIGDQPALGTIQHLGHDEDLKKFTSLGERNLLVVIQYFSRLVERSMGQRQSALDFCALIRPMMQKSTQVQVFVRDGHVIGLVLRKDWQRHGSLWAKEFNLVLARVSST